MISTRLPTTPRFFSAILAFTLTIGVCVAHLCAQATAPGFTTAPDRAQAEVNRVPANAAPKVSTDYFYYFKDKRTLEIDPGVIALFRSDPERGVAAVDSQLALLGVSAASVTQPAIAGWSIANAPPTQRTSQSADNLARLIVEQGLADFVSPVFTGTGGGPIIVTQDILVGFRSDVAAGRVDEILSATPQLEIKNRDWSGMPNVYRLNSASRNGFDVLNEANALAERPEVRFAEPDMIFTAWKDLIPDDTFFPELWGLHNSGQAGGTPDVDMDAPEAWDITTGDPAIVVVVLDDGVDQLHPDINQLTGAGFAPGGGADGGVTNPCDNHGTTVAGCVSAIINNARGVVGIAPDCPIRSARVVDSVVRNPCDTSGFILISAVVDALNWAQLIGARVTNNSNSYNFTSSAIAAKYEATRQAGLVHFGSAGNQGNAAVNYPASLPSVNAVSAVDRDGSLASFSNSGDGLAFSAPGVDIWTTDRAGADGWAPEDYVTVSGTSFSSPYAAGVAALILSIDPTFSPLEVELIMRRSAADLGDPGFDPLFGWGMVNAFQAVQMAIDPNFGGQSFCDDFNGPGVAPDSSLWSINATPFESGATDIVVSQSGGSVDFSGSATEDFWGGKTLDSTQIYTPTIEKPVTFEVDRLSMSHSGSAARSGVFIATPDRSAFVLFSENQGEGGWQVNATLSPGGGRGTGVNIPAFDGASFDDGGFHHIKLVADGSEVFIYLDDILGETSDFPVSSGLIFELGAFTRQIGDTVDAGFDNACVSIAGSLTPGDLDGDGDVDLADLAVMLGAFGRCLGDPQYNAAADLDSNGCVDLGDLSVLLGNFGA